jgi:hypothetical protein
MPVNAKMVLLPGLFPAIFPPLFPELVTELGPSRTAPLSRRHRLMLVAAAAGLVALLAVAWVLTPDERGHGTHQQLGLPPCTFFLLFGRPCPSCGMTTAWVRLVHGHVAEALRANIGGTLLGLLAVVSVPWLLVSAVCGRWLPARPGPVPATWLSAGIGVVTLIQWGWRMMNL